MRLYQIRVKITKSIRKLAEINLDACKLIGEGVLHCRNGS
jgi:hypothetical protein